MDSVHSSNGSIWLWVRLGLELNDWMTQSNERMNQIEAQE